MADAWAAELLDVAGTEPLRRAILDYGLRATMKIMAYDQLVDARGLRDHDEEEEDLRDLLAFVTYMETELPIYQQEVEETRPRMSPPEETQRED